ncbi:NAD regulator [Methylocystis sp. MJC1]|uniref:NUDIX hydrolase n=1 Tax=Methylocystis sp. MJC1 TaxID=2654282 RepID=UPI001FEDF011|nr:NAD regulator [Methylocystis sp. MJC1]UZX13666.1 NAD regulator [Methylocystis sp. MJC1]
MEIRAETLSPPVEIGLTAAIVAVRGDEPLILTTGADDESGVAALPAGPFDPVRHRTFEIGLRAWVAEQTGAPLGYVEQLYTFGDRGRHARAGDRDPHVVSIGYLALTRICDDIRRPAVGAWRSWHDFFPWEDWRKARPEIIETTILPGLREWVEEAPNAVSAATLSRRQRVDLLFGARGFNEENVLERYELLYEAGMIEEALRDGREAAARRGKLEPLGAPMRHDHRRILATAMGRLRAKMKYRPVIFELMPEAFTLTELQRTVEAIAGRHLHKQNFRRLVETSAIVEPTGEMSLRTGGRPAALFHFRRNVLQERPSPGLRVGIRS